jgi:hypothetical protein
VCPVLCCLHVPLCPCALYLYVVSVRTSALCITSPCCVPQCSIHVKYLCDPVLHTCIGVPQCSEHVPVCPCALYMYLWVPVLYTCLCVPQCSKHVPVCPTDLYMYLCAPVLYTCIIVPQCSEHVPVCPGALYMYVCPSALTCTCVPPGALYMYLCAPVLYTCTCVPQCALEPRNGPISRLYFYPFCMPFYGTRASRLSHSSPLLYLSSLSVYLSLFLSLNFSIYSPHSPSHPNCLFTIFCIYSYSILQQKSLFYERKLNFSSTLKQ